MTSEIKGMVYTEGEYFLKEELPGVHIVLTTQAGDPIKLPNGDIVGTITNGVGGFKLNVPRTPIVNSPISMPIGAYIKASFVGFQPQVKGIDFNADRQKDIILKPTHTELDEVVITASKNDTKPVKVPPKATMTLGQTKVEPEKKGWATFSKMKKGLIIGGASLGVILLVVGLSMKIRKKNKT